MLEAGADNVEDGIMRLERAMRVRRELVVEDVREVGDLRDKDSPIITVEAMCEMRYFPLALARCDSTYSGKLGAW
jgi:hypothetical protein